MNFRDIQHAFKNALDVIPNVEVYAEVPAQPVVPALMVYPEEMTATTTEPMTFIVWCVAGTVEMRGAWDRLGAWTDDDSTESIRAAVMADQFLGGTVSTVLPVTVRNIGIVDMADGRQVIQAQYVFSVWR